MGDVNTYLGYHVNDYIKEKPIDYNMNSPAQYGSPSLSLMGKFQQKLCTSTPVVQSQNKRTNSQDIYQNSPISDGSAHDSGIASNDESSASASSEAFSPIDLGAFSPISVNSIDPVESEAMQNLLEAYTDDQHHDDRQIRHEAPGKIIEDHRPITRDQTDPNTLQLRNLVEQYGQMTPEGEQSVSGLSLIDSYIKGKLEESNEAAPHRGLKRHADQDVDFANYKKQCPDNYNHNNEFMSDTKQSEDIVLRAWMAGETLQQDEPEVARQTYQHRDSETERPTFHLYEQEIARHTLNERDSETERYVFHQYEQETARQSLSQRDRDIESFENEEKISKQPINEDGNEINSKPTETYMRMIAKGILNAPGCRLMIHELYDYITKHYPYYKTAPGSWRNAVRHNLSVNECFIKNGRSSSGRGFFWSIHPACMADFRAGDFCRRKARKSARKMNQERSSCASENIKSNPYHHAVTTSTQPPSSGVYSSRFAQSGIQQMGQQQIYGQQSYGMPEARYGYVPQAGPYTFGPGNQPYYTGAQNAHNTPHRYSNQHSSHRYYNQHNAYYYNR